MRSTRSSRGVPGGRLVALLLAAAVLAGVGPAVAADPQEPSEELRRLQEEVEALREQLESLRPEDAAATDQRIAEIERRLEILTQEIEKQRLGRAAYRTPTESRYGLGPAASKVYTVDHGVSIGGYGEMLYQDYASRADDDSPAGETDTLDFLRAVFYFGYKFNDRMLINTELEFEHASTEEGGEVSVEFAYLDFLFRDEVNVRAGLLLLPVGFLDELHEPPIFLGARRPDVETRILPSTWRENGAGVFGDLGPVAYRAYLTNGLDSAGFTASEGIREGRQQGAEAAAEDFALVARFDWTVRPGLLLGASGYVGGSGQGRTTPSGQPFDGRVTLFDAHAEWRWRGLQLRGVWSRVKIDDAAEINEANGFVGAESIGSRLGGWYGEAGYDVLAGAATTQALIPYLRYERYDTQQEVPDGFAADPANDVKLWTLGVAYKPIEQIILKVDYQDYENAAGTGVDQFNVALGYLF